MKNLKLTLTTLISLLLCSALTAQMVSQPIKWSSKVSHVEGNIYEVQAIGIFDEGKSDWHIYDLGPYEDGPNPTALIVELPSDAKLVGKNYIKTKVTKIFDQMFGMEIGICEDKVIVAQKVEVTSKDSTAILATIEWMTCDNGTCLPPTEKDFKINLPPATGVVAAATTVKGKTAAENTAVKDAGTAPDTTAAPAGTYVDNSAAISAPTDSQPEKEGSIWAVIIEAILWGFAALLTPCVFPMVPMTVSFFLKGSENKAKGKIMATMYGIFIVALYTIPVAVIIAITYFAGGETVTADIFNWLATNWIPNILFFLIFMIFAASFFGAFEIVLPSWMVNKSDSKSDKGGIIGVFFMALTLVLVSFSCTGPIVGTILIKSTQGEIWQPIVTMLAFSTAFALPFTIFAFAPSLLKDLPKSGGWLNSVKVVLGFIEVALGFKFLSVADQTYHWGILDREVYLAIWIVVFTLLGFYLLGKIRFAHDTKMEHLGVGRLSLSIIVFSFVVYMIPGMWGAPLKALSGYLPPITSQDFSLVDGVSGNNTEASSEKGGPGKAKYSDFLHLPHGLQGFFEYKEAVEYAKSVNKPLFVDFTGHGCVNCREMESRVWSNPRVLKMLKEDYVVLALYADDKKEADEKDWVTNRSGRVLKSIGKINSHLAMTKFNVNAQPYYALLNPNDESQLIQSRGYNLDVNAFVKFLEDGIAKFHQKI
ncbi:MAG: thioredoxin family protein [Bacteroidales bacterium]